MSLRVCAVKANTLEAKPFCSWMLERYITFRTALMDAADAVFYNPQWIITVEPDDEWTRPVTITKVNCDKYTRENPIKLDYAKELEELLAWKREREEALKAEEEFCIANGIEF